MADADRTATGALELLRALEREPHRFGFFQALRKLECEFADRPRLGEGKRLRDDPVRLGQEPSMAFAPSTLSRFDGGKEGRAPRLFSYFFGLFGPNGPLPVHLTEYAHERILHEDDETFSRFADVFHHRLLSLFYRAWATTRPEVSFDRPSGDYFGEYVASTFGLGFESLRERDAMPDLAKLHHAGLLALQTRNARGLESIIESYFCVTTRIQEFVGQWLDLPHEYRCRLGSSRDTGILGHNLVVGARVWECQQKFRIRMGPLTLRDYERLLPRGESQTRLEAIVKNYIGRELAWDVQLILKRREVPRLELGGSGRLGWTTWLSSREADSDADQLVFTPAP